MPSYNDKADSDEWEAGKAKPLTLGEKQATLSEKFRRAAQRQPKAEQNIEVPVAEEPKAETPPRRRTPPPVPRRLVLE